MTKRDIKSIILYLDSAEAIEYLTNEQAGILFKAVFRYARTGQKLESSDTALTALFTILCAQIDRDHKKYEERCERNVANAKKRYEKHHQDDQPPAIACHRIRTHAIMIIIAIMTMSMIIRWTQMMITLTLLSSVTGVWQTSHLRLSGACMASLWEMWKSWRKHGIPCLPRIRIISFRTFLSTLHPHQKLDTERTLKTSSQSDTGRLIH